MMLDRARWLGTAVVLAMAALGAAACTTVSVSSIHYLGVPVAAPTDPASVEILRHIPRRANEKLGEVFLEPSGSPTVAEMEQALRKEAAKLGADAAVVVHDKFRRIGSVIQGPWWSRSSYPIYARTIVAVAIRYTER
jgi:hypothetical protein